MSIKITQQEFLQRCHKTHGDTYDYSITQYKTMRHKIKIICRLHGVFEQKPQDHVDGHGCKKCGKMVLAEKFSYSYDDFITKAKEKHGDKFSYPKENWNGYKSPMDMVCPTHGSFTQKPYCHVNSHGCQECGNEYQLLNSGTYSLNNIPKGYGYFYIIRFTNGVETFYKIGITKNISERFWSFGRHYKRQMFYLKYGKMSDMFYIEYNIKDKLKTYLPPPEKSIGGGRYECFNRKAIKHIFKIIDNYC
jgi:ferredoxin-like protein FixX